MRIIGLLAMLLISGYAEFLSIYSGPDIGNKSFSILQTPDYDYNVLVSLKNTSYYHSLFMKISENGELKIHNHYTFNANAEMTPVINSDSIMVPGQYQGKMSVLYLSEKLEPIKCLKFYSNFSQQFTSVMQIRGSQQFLAVNGSLFKFSSHSNIYNVYRLDLFKMQRVQQVNDGGFLLTGEFNMRRVSYDYGYYTGLVKLGLDLTPKWAVKFSIYNFNRASCITETVDGGFLIVGPEYKSLYIARITSSGYQEYAKELRPYGDTFSVEGVSMTKDGYILATGFLNQKLFVIKATIEGVVVFAKYFYLSTRMIGLSIKEISKGIIIIGYRKINNQEQIFVLELNKNGLTQNEKYPTMDFTVNQEQSSRKVSKVQDYLLKYVQFSTGQLQKVNIEKTQIAVSQTYLFRNANSNHQSHQDNNNNENNSEQENSQNDNHEQENSKDKSDNNKANEQSQSDQNKHNSKNSITNKSTFQSSPKNEDSNDNFHQTLEDLENIIILLIVVIVLLIIVLLVRNYNFQIHNCKDACKTCFQKNKKQTKQVDNLNNPNYKKFQEEQSQSYIELSNISGTDKGELHRPKPRAKQAML